MPVTNALRKSFTAVETKAIPDGPPGSVRSIVSVSGNVDFGNDRVIPGAFGDFITDVKSGAWPKWPTLLWNHAVELGLAAVTGKVTDMKELRPGDPQLPEKLRVKGLGGLQIDAQYNLKTMAGREAYEHVLAGDVADWSFMYEAPDTEIDAKGVRNLKRIYPVYECSNVLIGMNPETLTLGVKSLFKALAEAPIPESRRAKLLSEIREIMEQVEGYIMDPANEKTYAQGRKTYLIDAETGQLISTDIEAIEEKADATVFIGTEAFHQGAFNLAMAAIKALIQQELTENSDELDDVRWLAGIATDLRSWAKSENWDAIADMDSASGGSFGSGASGMSPATSLGGVPATDDSPALTSPPAMPVIDPFNRSAADLPVETKGDETPPEEESDVDEKKVSEFLELAMRDVFQNLDLSELIETPEPLNVLEDSGYIDGLTNWARQRVRR